MSALSNDSHSVSQERHGHKQLQPQPRYAPGSLAETIMNSTRPDHTVVNQIIKSRLPLALPPHAADPSSYITGLLYITPIYVTFEQQWKAILGNILVDPRIQSLFQALYLPKLMRSIPLKQDIHSLTGWPAHTIDEQLRIIGQTGVLGDFTRRIERHSEEQPHILLAYFYIFHMALFEGGRYMREKFDKAEEEFWQHLPSPVKPHMIPCQRATEPIQWGSELQGDEPYWENGYPKLSKPLHFFTVHTPEDGEELRREFKKRMLELETVLSDGERDDIVQEGKHIFKTVASLVGQIDQAVTDAGLKEAHGNAAFRALGRMVSPIVGDFRNSVAITKERGVKPSSVLDSGGDEPASTAGRAGVGLTVSSSPSLCGIHIVNWFMVAALMVGVFGALTYGRGSELL